MITTDNSTHRQHVAMNMQDALTLADELIRCVGFMMRNEGAQSDLYSVGAVDIVDGKPYPSAIAFIVERQ